MKSPALLPALLAASIFACDSPGSSATLDAAPPTDASGDAPPTDGDGGALSEFLGACTMNRDCVSEQCLVNPGVCTKTCGDRYDCPLASSWSCAELAAPAQLRICMCPGLTASPGCDLDCNGVDEDGTGTWRHAVMSSLRIVQTAAETAQYGFDLDGNGSRDNKFGLVVVPDFAAIVTGSTVPSPVVAELHQADVASGVLLGLVSFHGDDLQTDGCASARVYQARPSTPPDFSGGGAFDVDLGVGPSSTMYGSVAGGAFRASLGELPVRLRLGRAPNAKALLHLRRVEFECVLGSAGCVSGRLGGGIDEADLPTFTIAMTAEINYVLATDPQGTEAQQLRATLDTNHDNIITVTEVGAVFSYSPDMDLLDATGAPGHDGTRDSMSIALAFSTSGAVYTAPGE